MNFCPNCGTPCPDTANFCSHCGARLEPFSAGGAQDTADGRQPGPGSSRQDPYQAQGPNGSGQDGQPMWYPPYRSIAVCLILTIVTCGLYGLYWLYKVNNELCMVSGDYYGTSGGTVLLLCIVTCGIYGIYWAYKMGERCSVITGSQTAPILYLVLALLGMQIINLALFQDVLNKCS